MCEVYNTRFPGKPKSLNQWHPKIPQALRTADDDAGLLSQAQPAKIKVMAVSQLFKWGWVKTLSPCSSHQNSWDLWMFIPLKMVLIAIDPYPNHCHSMRGFFQLVDAKVGGAVRV